MISWMQKHNKYLVWTIWIATIAFIGAGFVGWGSYNLGSKANNVATIGEIDIKQSKLNRAYSNLYNQYNEMLEGKLDEAQAKELGLIQQAFSNIVVQTQILNFAQDAGIIISDEELVMKRREFKAFHKEGKFDRETYTLYLRNSRQKAKDFEASLREDMIINKTITLLQSTSLPLEKEAMLLAMGTSDKLLFKVLNKEDIEVDIDESKLKSFWENKKERYMTQKHYNLSLLWTQNNQDIISQDALKEQYAANSFKYTNKEGKALSFEEATEQVIKDIKLKKSKKTAQKAYIAFKKGNQKPSEVLDLKINDNTLDVNIWKTLMTKTVGDVLKPKITSEKYVSIKINSITEPRIMSFEEAKDSVILSFRDQMKIEGLQSLAKSTLDSLNKNNANTSDFISLQNTLKIAGLNTEENKQFSQNLFTSNQEKGIINLSNKAVIYHILEQKSVSLDENQTLAMENSLNQIKKRTFESNLLKALEKKYKTEIYMEGLTN